MRKHFRKIYLLMSVAFLLSIFPVSHGAVDAFEFDTELQEERFRKLSDEFRCPQCQNSNLTGSTGGIAEDLRREVYRLVIAGRSDQEITQFMYDRYGDFVLYRPQFRMDTVLLWVGPLLFFLFGLYFIFGIVRKARAPKQATHLSDIEQEKLKRLLK